LVPVGHPDFKSGEGRKTALGGFDSCLLRHRIQELFRQQRFRSTQGRSLALSFVVDSSDDVRASIADRAQLTRGCPYGG
jgi:hypothetical protein